MFEQLNTITGLDKEVIFNMMSFLSELYIGRNKLYDEGAELLSEGLANTSSVKALSIWNSNICAKGTKALSICFIKEYFTKTIMAKFKCHR